MRRRQGSGNWSAVVCLREGTGTVVDSLRPPAHPASSGESSPARMDVSLRCNRGRDDRSGRKVPPSSATRWRTPAHSLRATVPRAVHHCDRRGRGGDPFGTRSSAADRVARAGPVGAVSPLGSTPLVCCVRCLRPSESLSCPFPRVRDVCEQRAACDDHHAASDSTGRCVS